jgi:hypothetical protein
MHVSQMHILLNGAVVPWSCLGPLVVHLVLSYLYYLVTPGRDFSFLPSTSPESLFIFNGTNSSTYSAFAYTYYSNSRDLEDVMVV